MRHLKPWFFVVAGNDFHPSFRGDWVKDANDNIEIISISWSKSSIINKLFSSWYLDGSKSSKRPKQTVNTGQNCKLTAKYFKGLWSKTFLRLLLPSFQHSGKKFQCFEKHFDSPNEHILGWYKNLGSCEIKMTVRCRITALIIKEIMIEHL